MITLDTNRVNELRRIADDKVIDDKTGKYSTYLCPQPEGRLQGDYWWFGITEVQLPDLVVGIRSIAQPGICCQGQGDGMVGGQIELMHRNGRVNTGICQSGRSWN